MRINFKVTRRVGQNFPFYFLWSSFLFSSFHDSSSSPSSFSNYIRSHSQVSITQSTTASWQTFSFPHIFILSTKKQLTFLSYPFPKATSPGHLSPPSARLISLYICIHPLSDTSSLQCKCILSFHGEALCTSAENMSFSQFLPHPITFIPIQSLQNGFHWALPNPCV